MKKSVMFLINGLGIEKPKSYSIAIDQCMPNLSKTKETSYFTSAVTSSLEYRDAYQQFFLGETTKLEMNYLGENIINDNLVNNNIFQGIVSFLKEKDTRKFHIFLEPNDDRVVDHINTFVKKMNLAKDQRVYLHFILSQQTISDYSKLINTIKYVKFHLDEHINVGFILGRDYYEDSIQGDSLTSFKKMIFYCSCERWSETDKKLNTLQQMNIRPCEVPGFCATNSCFIQNEDVILFFNTNRSNYDKFIKAINESSQSVFKSSEYVLPFYSLIRLDSSFNIPFIAESIVYNNSLSNTLKKANKKALIITKEENISYINFLANGLQYVNNPLISFMKLIDGYYDKKENIINIIDNSNYDLIIFDYHMDVSKSINDLKEQLNKIDVVLGNIVDVCVNKHSLFITSLYGLKKTLPLADYNSEMVTINYEMQIPIFFFDYSYPRSRYALFPGHTNDILNTAICCIWENKELYSLIRPKGIINNILGAFKK